MYRVHKNMLVHMDGLETRNIQTQEISFPENLQIIYPNIFHPKNSQRKGTNFL